MELLFELRNHSGFSFDAKSRPIGLPRDMAAAFQRLERWGPAILLGIIFIDWFTGVGILVRIIGPLVNGLSSVIVGHRLF